MLAAEVNPCPADGDGLERSPQRNKIKSIQRLSVNMGRKKNYEESKNFCS